MGREKAGLVGNGLSVSVDIAQRREVYRGQSADAWFADRQGLAGPMALP
jgi:hypothetical protein